MIIDGKALAANVYAKLGDSLHGVTLGIIVVSSTPVTDSFVRIKSRAAERLGVKLVRFESANDVPQAALTTDGVIVQLPLPSNISIDAVLSNIPREKDVDGVNPTISEDDRIVHAPVAEAIGYIIDQYHIEVKGKKCVVVGAGRLVGAPTAALLKRLGGDVSVLTLGDSLNTLRDADIVVLGSGQPHLVKPEMVKEGCILLDAGASEQRGQVVGDADPACASKCALFTPVPGGIGPLAVAMIFKNLSALAGPSA